MIVASAGASLPANADEAADRAKARAAYDRGVAAQARGELSIAAKEFADADAIVPSPAALSAAFEAAQAADDAVIGAALCERAIERAADRKAPEERRAFCEGARKRTGKIVVTCAGHGARGAAATTAAGDAGEPCDVAIDGERAAIGKATFVRVGAHVLKANRGAWTRAVEVGAEQAIAIEVPAEGAAKAREGDRGAAPTGAGERWISPAWAIGVGGLAAVSLGFAIGSGVDTKNKHDAFVDARCAGPVHGDCAGLSKDGAAAQDRTNVLIGTTVGLGVIAATLGAISIFATRAPEGSAPAKGARARRPGAIGQAAILVGPSGIGASVTFE